MTADQTPEYLQLEGFVSYPREDMDAEYKDWLNLGLDKDRATQAKAAIALANHGGGHIIIGFQEVEQTLRSVTRPHRGMPRKRRDPGEDITIETVPKALWGVCLRGNVPQGHK